MKNPNAKFHAPEHDHRYEAAAIKAERQDVTDNPNPYNTTAKHLNVEESFVYTGSSSTGVVHRRLITKIDGDWIEWEPVGYRPIQKFRRMKLSSFKAWVLNYTRNNPKRVYPYRDLLAQNEASNPQEQAATTAKTLTEEQENELHEWYDEREREWSLRDAGSNDGEGESYSARNL